MVVPDNYGDGPEVRLLLGQITLEYMFEEKAGKRNW